MSRIALPALAALAFSSIPTFGQRLVGYDAAGFVHEFPSPLGGPCIGPSDPTLTFPLGGLLGACALPGGAGGPNLGDVGVNTLADTFWVTDGAALAEYSRFGAPLSAYNGPIGSLGPLTGLGVDTLGGLLWATDGTFCQSFLLPPSGSGCLATLTPASAAFLCTLTGALVTDVEWDPNFGVLWFGDACGTFALTTGGAVVFPPSPLFGCGPMGALEGVAVDTAAVVTGSLVPVIYGTDRTLVAYDQQACCPTPPTSKVYPSATCFPTPGTLHGLSYTARPNHYGTPSPFCVPSSFPIHDTVGQSVVGNTTFAYTLAGAIPGSLPFILYNFSPLCPGFTFPGPGGCVLTLWINPAFPFGSNPMPIANAAGNSSITVPLGPGTLGACIYTQLAVFSGPNVDFTDAIETVVTVP